MGMGGGFSTREQRWCQPIPDSQNDGLGQLVFQSIFFFPRVFALFFFVWLFESIIMLGIKVL
jgi:hypothetical protein